MESEIKLTAIVATAAKRWTIAANSTVWRRVASCRFHRLATSGYVPIPLSGDEWLLRVDSTVWRRWLQKGDVQLLTRAIENVVGSHHNELTVHIGFPPP